MLTTFDKETGSLQSLNRTYFKLSSQSVSYKTVPVNQPPLHVLNAGFKTKSDSHLSWEFEIISDSLTFKALKPGINILNETTRIADLFFHKLLEIT